MTYTCNSRHIFVIGIAFLIIQIANTSPLGMYSPSKCYCPSNNFYNMMQNSPYSYNNYYQNNQNPINSYPKCCPYCKGQNVDTCSCNCNGYLYSTQMTQNCPPESSNAGLVCSNFANMPLTPCPETYKNFGYQLQVPLIPRCESNYGSLNGIIDKTVRKCPSSCLCKPLY